MIYLTAKFPDYSIQYFRIYAPPPPVQELQKSLGGIGLKLVRDVSDGDIPKNIIYLLVFFRLVFDQGYVSWCANFYDSVIFRVFFQDFRRSHLSFYPGVPLPPPPGACICDS